MRRDYRWKVQALGQRGESANKRSRRRRRRNTAEVSEPEAEDNRQQTAAAETQLLLSAHPSGRNLV